MRHILAVVIFAFSAQAAFADQQDKASSTWMCLFEKLPIEIIEPKETLAQGYLKLSISSHFAHPLNALAVDVQLFGDAIRFEKAFAISLEPALQLDETRIIGVPFEIEGTQRQAFLQANKISARAAVANALDENGDRLVIREHIGPAFTVFWPDALQSSRTCE